MPVFLAPLLKWLWDNKKLVIEVIGLIALALLIWWFGFHIPKKYEEEKEARRIAEQKVEAAKKAVVLLEDIQKGKVNIDAATQTQVSSIRSKVIPHNRVIIHSGRVLPRLSTNGVTPN